MRKRTGVIFMRIDEEMKGAIRRKADELGLTITDVVRLCVSISLTKLTTDSVISNIHDSGN
jgi:antitoxin component of RelBE/YafQ-DinJ toxin-antitoxin module